MKKIILLLILATAIGYAESPNWGVNPWDFKYTATHTCVLIIDSIESTDEDDIVAAFVDGECRGLARPTYFPMPGKERHTINMMLYSNNSFGEFITFKAYDASENTIYDIQNYEIEFIENENYGDDINVKKLFIVTNEVDDDDEQNQTKPVSITSIRVYIEQISDYKDGSHITTDSIENGDFVLLALKKNIPVIVENENGDTPFTLELKEEKIYLKKR